MVITVDMTLNENNIKHAWNWQKDAGNWHDKCMKLTWKMHEIDIKDAWNWHERCLKLT